MARPARYNADYYTHDADLRNDRRVKAIRAKFGATGYGVLHMLLEAMTAADFTQLSTDPLELELLSGDFGVLDTEINSLIQFAERIGYFSRNEAGMVTCPDLVRWLEPVFEKRSRSKATALSGGKSNAPWAGHTAEVFARDSYKCVICGTLDDLTIDHIIPRAAGGSDEIENLQTLCSSCNSRKGPNLPQSVTVIPQSKVKKSRVEKRKGEGVGEEAPPPPLSSEISSPQPTTIAPPAPQVSAPPPSRPRTMPADEAPVFQRPAFKDFLVQMEYGHVDVGHYWNRMLRKVADIGERTNKDWEGYILNWLDKDKAEKKLVLPEGTDKEAAPSRLPKNRIR